MDRTAAIESALIELLACVRGVAGGYDHDIDLIGSRMEEELGLTKAVEQLFREKNE